MIGINPITYCCENRHFEFQNHSFQIAMTCQNFPNLSILAQLKYLSKQLSPKMPFTGLRLWAEMTNDLLHNWKNAPFAKKIIQDVTKKLHFLLIPIQSLTENLWTIDVFFRQFCHLEKNLYFQIWTHYPSDWQCWALN